MNSMSMEINTPPDINNIVGGVIPNETEIINSINSKAKREPRIRHCDDEVFVLDNFLSHTECLALIDFFKDINHYSSVSVTGLNEDATGSIRSSMWTPKLSQKIFKELISFIPENKKELYSHPFKSIDWWQHNKNNFKKWRLNALSPMFRFMRYQSGGEHYPHYDQGYIYPNLSTRALQSIVFYLTTNEQGGCLRFIDDKQTHLPIFDRKTSDWSRAAEENEVVSSFSPMAGSVIIFDQRKCHDVEKYFGKNDRFIIRSDLIYTGY